MKKTVLTILTVLLLFAMLVLLTGCGASKVDVEQPTNNENKTATTEEIDVIEVYATSDNYAIVRGNDSNIYIIDNTGKVQGQLDSEPFNASTDSLKTRITNEGNALVLSSIGSNGTKIYDKSGNVILEKTSSESYDELSDDDYTIKSTKTSDFESGNTTTREIVDLQGNVKKKIEGTDSYTYVGGHIWSVSNGRSFYNDDTDKSFNNDTDLSYNFRTEDEKTYPLSDGGVYIKNTAIILGSGEVKTNNENFKLSDIIAIDEDYYYNKEDKTVYKWDGTKVKELSSGDGAIVIEKIDDKYYVKSGTGYYYTLDEKFESQSEPFKIESEKNLRTLTFGKDTIIVEQNVSFENGGYSGTWDHVYIYDFEGNLKQDLDEGWDAQTDSTSNFVYRIKRLKDREYNERTGSVQTTTVGNQSHDGFINRNTGELLKIYK